MMDARPAVRHPSLRQMVPSAIKKATTRATRVSRVSFESARRESFIEYSNQLMILYHKADTRHPCCGGRGPRFARVVVSGSSGGIAQTAWLPIVSNASYRAFWMPSLLKLFFLLAVAVGLTACARTAQV